MSVYDRVNKAKHTLNLSHTTLAVREFFTTTTSVTPTIFLDKLINYAHLREINLSYCSLKGVLFPPITSHFIHTLQYVEQLDISNNNLTQIPIFVCHLKNLLSLDASHNEITCLPPEICNLPYLSVLCLQNNSLKNASRCFPPQFSSRMKTHLKLFVWRANSFLEDEFEFFKITSTKKALEYIENQNYKEKNYATLVDENKYIPYTPQFSPNNNNTTNKTDTKSTQQEGEKKEGVFFWGNLQNKRYASTPKYFEQLPIQEEEADKSGYSIIQVDASANHLLLLTDTGFVLSCGATASGQLGHADSRKNYSSTN
eukprot:TRINITY_DN14489_c0_g1_i1.p1 TRINITY_DN14489_c0_g1~~TRINITY_DN14489_c0_g1_i1.p1  ORF type:complete len:313 (-),score=50.32 TRINITY_DN14489_c0_g1_i1:96-1034(-)